MPKHPRGDHMWFPNRTPEKDDILDVRSDFCPFCETRRALRVDPRWGDTYVYYDAGRQIISMLHSPEGGPPCAPPTLR